VEKLKEEVVGAGVDVVGKLSVEVGGLEGAESLKGGGAGVEEVVGADAAGVLKIDGAGAGGVNILWGAAGVAAICAGAGAAFCTDTDESWIAFLNRRILYESYATTSSTTMNASISLRIGIVQPGTAKVIVLSVAMIILTPSVSAYNMFKFNVKLMSVLSR